MPEWDLFPAYLTLLRKDDQFCQNQLPLSSAEPTCSIYGLSNPTAQFLQMVSALCILPEEPVPMNYHSFLRLWVYFWSATFFDFVGKTKPWLRQLFFFPSVGRPKVAIPPSNQDVLSGANVSFYCSGYGDPQPNVLWKKNGKTVTETSGEKSLLQIALVGVDDAGSYECVYRNKYGEDSRSALLTVDGQTGKGVCF